LQNSRLAAGTGCYNRERAGKIEAIYLHWMHHILNFRMNNQQEDKSPLFASWNAWYVFVLAFLVVLVVLFTLFTNYFS